VFVYVCVYAHVHNTQRACDGHACIIVRHFGIVDDYQLCVCMDIYLCVCVRECVCVCKCVHSYTLHAACVIQR